VYSALNVYTPVPGGPGAGLYGADKRQRVARTWSCRDASGPTCAGSRAVQAPEGRTHLVLQECFRPDLHRNGSSTSSTTTSACLATHEAPKPRICWLTLPAACCGMHASFCRDATTAGLPAHN